MHGQVMSFPGAALPGARLMQHANGTAHRILFCCFLAEQPPVQHGPPFCQQEADQPVFTPPQGKEPHPEGPGVAHLV